MAKQLTENQQKFIDALFDEAAGDVVMAKRIAGYSDGTPTRSVTESLKDEIFEATKSYMARLGPKAAIAYGSALDDPTQLGVKERMLAAGQVLDRSGLVKTEKVAVTASGGLFILPPKDTEEDDET